MGALGYQHLSRVRDGRHSRVGDQGAGLPLLNAVADNLSPLVFVVLKIADHGLFNAKMIQQLQGDPGVFGGDEVRLGQSLLSPGGKVSQIPNRSPHNI